MKKDPYELHKKYGDSMFGGDPSIAVEESQVWKCLRGEHEAAETVYVASLHTPGRVAAYVCKHCRCVFVEK